jgi:hypothetical protein
MIFDVTVSLFLYHILKSQFSPPDPFVSYFNLNQIKAILVKVVLLPST